MAQVKIVWSKEAQDNFQQIALFYYQRTGNAKYSNRLYRMKRDSLRLAARYPYMYPATSVHETRAFVSEYFKVFYSVCDRYILVESVFDTRQDPSKLPPHLSL